MDEPLDIFLSYSRDDSARAELVRDKLEALGLKVFFDAEGIDAGAEFPMVIDKAVRSAKCVLGLWSKSALQSRWVRIESRIGLDHSKLVAAVIDGTRPEDLPAEFYNVNVEDLTTFNGQADHEGWVRIQRAIGRRVGRQDLAQARTARAAAPPPPPPAPRYEPSYEQAPTQSQRQSGGGLSPLIYALIGGAAVAAVAFFVLRDGRDTQHTAPAATEQAAIETQAPVEGAPAPPTVTDDAAARQRAADEARAREQAAAEQTQRQEAEVQSSWTACNAGELSVCRRLASAYPNHPIIGRVNARIEQLTQPVAADLSGGWRGYYAQGASRTNFAAEFRGASGEFRGRMSEPANFGDGSSRTLYANVAGRTFADGRVEFVKTYDGTAGVSHSVRYEGRISDDGRTITGVWVLSGGRDQFSMSRN